MKALRNVWRDLSYQFSWRGALLQRLALVGAYYGFYARERSRGKPQGDSRMAALLRLSVLGWSGRLLRVRGAQGRLLELDAFSAAFLLREIDGEKAYERLEAFVPRPGQTVVDVGAHQGIFTVGAAEKVGSMGRVLAIEPFPASFALLERNVRLNGFSHVALVCRAVADYGGRAVLRTTPAVSGGHSLVFEGPERGALGVPVETLDRLLEEAGLKPDLIKIDVEGSCLAVLRGASKTLSTHPRLVMEVESGPAAVNEVVSHIENLGYRARVFDSMVYAEAA